MKQEQQKQRRPRLTDPEEKPFPINDETRTTKTKTPAFNRSRRVCYN